MSAGLIALKSDAEITMPSRTKSGSVPALIEFVPRMVSSADLLGSPELESTVRPGTCPCSAWSKAAVGVVSIFSAFTVETDPAMVPFYARRRR